MSEGRKTTPLAISLDEASIAEIDRIAKLRRDSRSSVMRAAIQAGLPMIETGSGEMVLMDGPLSEDVKKVGEWQKWSRQKVIIESIRLGLPSVAARFASHDGLERSGITGEDAKKWEEIMLAHDPESLPLARDYQKLRQEAGRLRRLLRDAETMVPAVEERMALLKRHVELQVQSGTFFTGFAYGVSTEEIKRQIAEFESQIAAKMGADSTVPPAKPNTESETPKKREKR